MLQAHKIVTRIREQGLPGFLRSLPDHIVSVLKNPFKILSVPSISRSDFKSGSRASGFYCTYGREGSITIKPPKNEGYPEKLDEVVGSHKCEPGFVGCSESVIVVGPYALVFDSGKALLEPVLDGKRLDINIQLSGPWRVLTLVLFSWLNNHIPLSPTKRIPLAAHCLSHHANNYGVWFASDLMKLRAVEQYAEKTGTDPMLLVNENLSSWMRETFDLLGYGPEDRIAIDCEHVFVDELIVPKTRRWVSRHPEIYPSDKQWLRNRLCDHIDMQPAENMPTRFIISRQGTDRRRFENHEAVGDCLESYDFEFVRPEEHSIQEQIRLFANAELVVGAFGSAMTNVMWATDATVIEIFPDGYTGHDFFLLARECGHEYYGIAGEQVQGDPERLPKHRDITVNTDRIESIISDIVRTQSN